MTTTLPSDSRRFYRVRLLRGKFGHGPAKKDAIAVVSRASSGSLYLSMSPRDRVFKTGATEGTDFEFTTQPPTEVQS